MKNKILIISVILIACLFIINLPINLKLKKCGYDKGINHITYCYKNYFGITKIKGIFDPIAFENDTVGDYNYISGIYLGFGFSDNTATVYILNNVTKKGNPIFSSACINKQGDLLYYGVCNNQKGVITADYKNFLDTKVDVIMFGDKPLDEWVNDYPQE